MPVYPIRRRPRECKTCLACRASKVRCDRNVPCSNCVKRNFTCSYSRLSSAKPALSSASATESSTPSQPFSFSTPYQSTREQPRPPPPSRRYDPYTESSAGPVTGEVVDISQTEWDEINTKMVAMEQLLGSLQSLFNAHPAKNSHRASEVETRESTRSESVYGSGALKSGTVHFGSRSALVDILDKSKLSEDTAQALPQDELLTELVLGNESTAYPFVDLWSSDPFTFNIAGVCAILPDDEQCRRFLGFYKDIGAVLYPVLPDLFELERNTNRLLEGRRREGGVYRPNNERLIKPFGMSLPFLSLLFAVLAAGCQLSDLSGRDRELTSWIYVSCAYQCLRMLNYVSRPSVEVIQTLLIIGNVLSYNMNAGASYTMLGMTERLCMVLGLHVESPGYSFAEQAIRRRLWWAMAFQNSHFSLAYDRPSITMVSQPEIPFDPKSMPGHRTYFETLCQIVSLALEILRSRMHPEPSHSPFHEIREYKQRIQRILAEVSPHLRYREQCRTLREHIERTQLRLHSSYLLSVLCRVSLNPHAHLDDQRRSIIRDDCISNLMDTIDAFVELHEINSHCSRSYISLQRSIASAFLLVANDDSPQTWELIDRLETVLADHVYADGHEDHNSRTDSVKHLASSLRALREIRDACREPKSALPADTSTSSLMGFPSPPLVDAASDMLPPAAPGGPVALPMEDGDMRHILGRVPDVMLFPSMSGISPPV
ncbi:hypothetical protein N7474_007499 [Penicillium riverlandense]|uniref:uncharacterized protein n=1 Tax=Penicillium riverlandense TaxID=1903569 RepID=UPI002548DAB5|nr:uncharacterized protein N7474_007499 [Penicillium riverlandense]KAJ5815722.1 hypothetical protein N7474_007499 [Penicillium riverlandense]